MRSESLRLFFSGLLLGMLFVAVFFLGGFVDRVFGLPVISNLPFISRLNPGSGDVEVVVVHEESVVSDVVEKVAPSVVTVSISTVQSVPGSLGVIPFDPFGFFGSESEQRQIEEDIGTGFVVDESGLIVTNKHVVSDVDAEYRIVTDTNEIYEVENIYRDPVNDLAILKVNANLPAIDLGDSSDLKVGQLAIAIGTALGEFRQTVTSGVISGLGRGITAGSPYEGFVERIDDVIQTDAAINPGNSGGPLLNSLGQVIGVNVAVAQSGQNIAFAIPINVVKDSVANFRQTGEFNRPFLGVRYYKISKQSALVNEVPQGIYVTEVIANSSADNAGILQEDIILNFDGIRLDDDAPELAQIINSKKIGDVVNAVVWRDGEEMDLKVTLEGRQ
jgi:S1-C subfamily serine protease